MQNAVPGQRVQVVWFKRDLRVVDHEPLSQAALRGPVLPLVVVEREYWKGPDVSARQFTYYRECVADLTASLAGASGVLSLSAAQSSTAEVCEALQAIFQVHGAFQLWSHQETGNAWTYARDKAVARWCRQRGIEWTQCRSFGVVRGPPKPRERWASQWNALMAQPLASLPKHTQWIAPMWTDCMPTAASMGLRDDPLTDPPVAGRNAALRTLTSFLRTRGRHYTTQMSSPATAADACSRLSTALAYGSLSLREVTQAAWARLHSVSSQGDRLWTQSLKAFVARLHWHCHFIQKLETEPTAETVAFSKACARLRPRPGNAKWLEAWALGQTGYPFVDAVMRSLRATGWTNFRMRAMLMSFVSYDLWLPWQETGLVLARLFVDYEPGIHWPQCQMQSGETGINTLRMYSPVKQGFDHDGSGDFIRQWVPELRLLKGPAVHEPWKLPAAERDTLCGDYPSRIVDHLAAVAAAKKRIALVRTSPEGRAEAQQVFQMHGSRKRTAPLATRKNAQREIEF